MDATVGHLQRGPELAKILGKLNWTTWAARCGSVYVAGDKDE